MKCAFLYNPHSGKGKIGRKIGEIEQRLRSLFGEVVVFRAESAEEMTALAYRWARRCEVLVFAGGDGTFHAVLNGAIGARVTLGFIPAGTSNDAAGNLGIPKHLRGALGTIAAGRTKRVDCMQINGERCALGIIAAGSLTRVTYETPQKNKQRLGWFAYAFAVFRRLWHMRTFYAQAECDGEKVCGNFVLALILNGKKVARFSVNRGADLEDGMCEAVLVRQFGGGALARCGARWRIFRMMILGAKHGGSGVVRLRGKEIKVRKTDSVLWDFDGEQGIKGEIHVRVLRGAVKVFAPN